MRDALVVSERLELVHHRQERRLERRHPARARVAHRDAELQKAGAGRRAPIARVGRERRRLARDRRRPQQLALLLERPAQVDERRRAPSLRRKRDGALEEARRRSLLRRSGPAPGARQAPVRAVRDPRERRVAGPQLAAQHDDALEVMADELVGRRQPRAALLEPVGEALVERRSRLLGHPVVRGVADELMTEAVAPLGGPGRLDEVGPHERAQLALHLTAEHRCDAGAGELLALDRGRLDDLARGRRQQVQARGEERLDRRRDSDRDVDLAAERRLLVEHRDDLLDVERVALGDLEDPRRGALRQRRAAEQVREQLPGLGLGQGLEEDRRRVRLAPAPCRPVVEQLGPSHDQQDEWRVARPLRHVLDELDERWLGPLQVVDDEHERPRAGERLEHPPHGPARFVGHDRGTGRARAARRPPARPRAPRRGPRRPGRRAAPRPAATRSGRRRTAGNARPRPSPRRRASRSPRRPGATCPRPRRRGRCRADTSGPRRPGGRRRAAAGARAAAPPSAPAAEAGVRRRRRQRPRGERPRAPRSCLSRSAAQPPRRRSRGGQAATSPRRAGRRRQLLPARAARPR